MELTFLTVLPFVAGGADAGPINAGAVAPAGGVDALIHGHIALGALPAAVALACPFGVLSVPAAQHRAGGCKTRDRAPGHGGQRPKGPIGLRRRSLPGVSAELATIQARMLAGEVQRHLQMINNHHHHQHHHHKNATDSTSHCQFNAYYVPGWAQNALCDITFNIIIVIIIPLQGGS